MISTEDEILELVNKQRMKQASRPVEHLKNIYDVKRKSFQGHNLLFLLRTHFFESISIEHPRQ